MKNQYEIYCKSAQERLAVLQILTKFGCRIHGQADYTAEDFDAKHPYFRYPTIQVVIKDKYITGVVSSCYGGIEQLSDVVAALLMPLKPVIVFPKPSKYSIVYKTLDGKVDTYQISNPLSADNDKITAYAFGKGIRSFKKANISAFEKIEECPF